MTRRLVRTPKGVDLVLSRTFRAHAEDVWASVTDPERTALWFGPWEGRCPDIRVRMAFEEQQPWTDVRVVACEEPLRLVLKVVDDFGTWRLALRLSEVDGETTLTLVHHLPSADGLGEVGPGWEYYLDMLVASRVGGARPVFDDYYPALKVPFESLSTVDS
ncbi:SRPBCC domain-containing protein [Actinosynnema sp. NPDC020468]|uniref:SRPBCC domain-containing protein n=1 Tax=Actinosynnema sp. NPDC020468 TaxID=3154488 RepID=UPI0033FD1A33